MRCPPENSARLASKEIHDEASRPNSYSPDLLQATSRLFEELGYPVSMYPTRGHLVLYRNDAIARYMGEIGSRPPHRLRQFQETKERWLSLAESARLESV